MTFEGFRALESYATRLSSRDRSVSVFGDWYTPDQRAAVQRIAPGTNLVPIGVDDFLSAIPCVPTEQLEIARLLNIHLQDLRAFVGGEYPQQSGYVVGRSVRSKTWIGLKCFPVEIRVSVQTIVLTPRLSIIHRNAKPKTDARSTVQK